MTPAKVNQPKSEKAVTGLGGTPAAWDEHMRHTEGERDKAREQARIYRNALQTILDAMQCRGTNAARTARTIQICESALGAGK